jgi:hypothetical protein
MAITRVVGQAGGDSISNATSAPKAFAGNVTAGNLVVVLVTKWNSTHTAIVVGDVSKTAGTATLGVWQMDRTDYQQSGAGNEMDTAIFSAPVTGTGSLTVAVAGAAGCYWLIAVNEYAGADVSASRVAGGNGGGDANNGTPTTGTVASGMGAVFCGVLCTITGGATTHTPGADYTQIYEAEDGASFQTGSSEDRIVGVDTTDAADWLAPTTVPWAASLAVYKEATGGGSRNPVAMGFVLE